MSETGLIRRIGKWLFPGEKALPVTPVTAAATKLSPYAESVLEKKPEPGPEVPVSGPLLNDEATRIGFAARNREQIRENFGAGVRRRPLK